MKQGAGIWPTVLNCLLPTALSIFAVFVAWGAGANILSNDLFGLPTVWIAIPLLSLCIGAIFQSHFNSSVRDGLVWICVAISGLSLIAFFAFLHRADGVLCTAPVCTNAVELSVQDPRFRIPLGRSLPPLPTAPAQTDSPTVAVDTSPATAFYFSMVTFTTLGYGDFQPAPRMRLLASFEALLGYAFLGLLVGLLIDLGGRRLKTTAAPADTSQISRQAPQRRSKRPPTWRQRSKQR